MRILVSSYVFILYFSLLSLSNENGSKYEAAESYFKISNGIYSFDELYFRWAKTKDYKFWFYFELKYSFNIKGNNLSLINSEIILSKIYEK